MPDNRPIRRNETYIPALPDRVSPAPPAWLAERQPLDLTPYVGTDGAVERTSAMDRARALRVRLAPFVALWAILAVIVGAVVLMVASNAPVAALVGLLTFSGMTAYTYYKLNHTDYQYSREGSIRHQVDTAADLAIRQMEHEHELRRMALDSYLSALERQDRK